MKFVEVTLKTKREKRSAKLEHKWKTWKWDKTVELPAFSNRRFGDEEKPKYLRSFRIYCCLFTSGQFCFYLGATVSINMFALHLAYSDHHHHHNKIYNATHIQTGVIKTIAIKRYCTV